MPPRRSYVIHVDAETHSDLSAFCRTRELVVGKWVSRQLYDAMERVEMEEKQQATRPHYRRDPQWTKG